MTLAEVVKILDCDVLTGADELEMTVNTGCGCDLMSDVLAFIKSESLLLTGLNNTQAIRTAEIAEVKAVCFVRGKRPSSEMINLALSKGIVLLTTLLPMFEACGKLFANGLAGCSSQMDSSRSSQAD